MKPKVVISNVKILEKESIRDEPRNKSIDVKIKAFNKVMFPDAKGLFFVLCIFLSVSLSKIWFKDADEAARNAYPSKLERPEMTSL